MCRRLYNTRDEKDASVDLSCVGFPPFGSHVAASRKKALESSEQLAEHGLREVCFGSLFIVRSGIDKRARTCCNHGAKTVVPFKLRQKLGMDFGDIASYIGVFLG